MEGEWEVVDRSGGLIKSDHFSLDTNREPSEDGSSGSPGWIEPRSDALYGPKHFSELWSDSSSDRVEDDDLASRGDVQPPTGFVWWKLPLHLLRANPFWSFSMAAAFLGFVILGRRIYNMKKNTPTLHLKLLPHDKKVANQAARLNDAISMVKRVPIIRPPLPPSVGMNQWSMMRV